MLSKKRKIDDPGAIVLDQKRKEGLVSLFRQVAPKSDTDIEITDVGMFCTILTIHAAAGEKVSTQKIRDCAAVSGFGLAGCDVTFDEKSLKLAVYLGTSPEMKHKFAEGPKREILRGGMTEDDIRIEAITKYAQSYLGNESPPLDKIKIGVFDPTTGKSWKSAEPGKCTSLDIRITGWDVCSLVHLETFQLMFPCHVDTVHIDNRTVYITLRTRLNPFCRTFSFI